MIVRVEDVFLELRVPGDVHLGDAMMRDVVEVIVGIEIVVLRRDVDVVHVEQDSAVGPLDDLGEEFPLGHLRNVELGVAAHVLDAIGSSRKSRTSRMFSAVPGRRERVGHRQEVVRVASIHAPPAEVIGQPGGLRALDERLEAS